MFWRKADWRRISAESSKSAARPRAISVSALGGENQNKENVICENFKLNEIRNSFYSFQLKNNMEKYWCGDMFSKPSGLFTPPVEENDSETKGQLISKEVLIVLRTWKFDFSLKGGLI